MGGKLNEKGNSTLLRYPGLSSVQKHQKSEKVSLETIRRLITESLAETSTEVELIEEIKPPTNINISGR